MLTNEASQDATTPKKGKNRQKFDNAVEGNADESIGLNTKGPSVGSSIGLGKQSKPVGSSVGLGSKRTGSAFKTKDFSMGGGGFG
jgi:hypothetical protein